MIQNLLNSFYSTIMGNERRAKSAGTSAEQKKESITDKTGIKDTLVQSLSEVEVIERAFGKLYEGKEIKTDLRTLLNLLPRKRERSDAYKGLIKELKEVHGVSLQIIPQWKLNREDVQREEGKS